MKIFRFVQKVFFIGLPILSSFTNAGSLSCISMINQECKTRPQIFNVNSNNPIFYPFSIKISKCSGNCNNINDPYSNVCVTDFVKNLNIKVFNLMPRTNETRFTECHETCKCECRLDAIVCNNKQRWNKNPSSCDCECDKACDVGEYVGYEHCKCRKKLIDKLVDECTETFEEVKLASITLAENENSYKFSSYTVYTALFWIFFTINVGGIGAYFI